MINKTFRRLALGAAAVTVAGVVVPVAMATAASAAESSGVTATPSTQTVAPGTTANYYASFTPAGSTPSHPKYAVSGGPAALATPSGTCTGPNGGPTPPAGTYTCGVVTAAGDAPGSYTVTIFDDITNNGLTREDPFTTVQLVIAGPSANTTISPTSAHNATGNCQAYTVSSTDANGNPAAGTVAVTISQTVPTGPTPGLRFCNPTDPTFPAPATPNPASTTTVSGTNTTYTKTYNFTLSTGGAGNPPAGSVIVGVGSQTAGTVNIFAGKNSVGGSGQAATLTVDPGNPATAGVGQTQQAANNDTVTNLTLNPKTVTVIKGATVTEKATVTNAQGDPLGGVQVSAVVTGANPNAEFTCGGVTDQTGVATCTYPATNTGNDTLTAFVEQDKNGASNKPGPNSGEPQDTAAVTVAAQLNTPVLTDSCTGGTCYAAATAASQNVTFTLTSTVNGKAGAPAANQVVTVTTATAGYTLSSSQGTTDAAKTTLTATTDANGQVAVTVNHTAGTPTNGSVTASFVNGGAGPVSDSPNVDFVVPSAAALTLTPNKQTVAVGGTVTETVTVVDQLMNPVAGAPVNYTTTGDNSTTPGANGTCTTNASGQCTITYTDKGPALAPTTPPAAPNTRSDSIQATVVGVKSAKDTATVTFVAGTAKASNVSLTSSATAAPVTADPATGKTAPVTTLKATVTDANGNALQNDAVTFSSTGVGVFTDKTGKPVTGSTDTEMTNGNGVAITYVRSTAPGTQTVTATADGVPSNQVTITYTNAQFTPVTPERLVDTRTNQGGLAASPGPLAANTAYYFGLSSTDVPTGEAAYVFNVTAVQPSGAGNLRIGPSCPGTAIQVPTTSLINYQANTTVANDVIVPNTSTCDGFVIYSAGSSTNVVIDIQGYYGTTAGYSSGSTPTRAVDTRSGLGGHSGVVAANTSASFTLAGVGGVPAVGSAKPAVAVAINVTAIGPGGVGNLRIYPDGASVPTTSNINYIPGVDKAAFVVVQLPANGKIDVYSAGSSTNVAIDIFGYYPSTSTVVTQTPVRVFDSRNGVELKAGTPVDVPVTTAGGATKGVPAGAQAVLISVTAIHAADSTGIGNLRVYPTGTPTPTISNINYISKTTDVANFAIVPVGSNGSITLYSAGSNINATVDILGYVPATG